MKHKPGFMLALTCIGYYALVCVVTGRFGGAQLIWLALAGFFGLLTRLSRGQAGQRVALRICIALLVIGLAIGVVAEGAILSAMVREPASDADYVIVLGAKVNGTTPSRSLRYRINSAAAYLQENPRSTVIASGGQGPDENISEADAIASALERQGIDPSRILREDGSTSTEENLEFSLALIESDGGTAESSVVIVTSDFHMFRALRIAGKAGFVNVSGQTAPSMWALIPQKHLREALAVTFYFVTGAL